MYWFLVVGIAFIAWGIIDLFAKSKHLKTYDDYGYMWSLRILGGGIIAIAIGMVGYLPREFQDTWMWGLFLAQAAVFTIASLVSILSPRLNLFLTSYTGATKGQMLFVFISLAAGGLWGFFLFYPPFSSTPLN